MARQGRVRTRMVKNNLTPVISAAVLSIACSHPPLPAPPPAPIASALVPDSSPQMNWSDSIKAVEVAAIRAAKGKVSRVGSELRIQLLDSRTAIFEDDTPSSQWWLCLPAELRR